MEALKSYLANLPNPIFIIEAESREIIFANKTALRSLEGKSCTYNSIDEILQTIKLPISGKFFTQFQFTWYEQSQQEINTPDKSYQVIELKPRNDIPNNEIIEKWKQMISLMLHRFRSPLNGVTGYLELLEDDTKDELIKKRVTLINRGIHHIYNMMDELEVLYNIPSETDKVQFEAVNVEKVVREVLLWFKEIQRERINIGENIADLKVDSDPNSLKEILKQLLSNSLEHSRDFDIIVDTSSKNGAFITVKNTGGPIPAEIKDQIFHPFVTTKATNFGIGLTKALLYARQIGGTIFLEQEKDEIIFILYFPLNS